MKQALILLIALVLSACPQTESTSGSTQPSSQSTIDVKTQNTTISFQSLSENKPLAEAPSNVSSVTHLFAKKASNAQVEDSGEVVKVLADDMNGSRHQRFLVRVVSGQTLLFAHNIDLAPRINDIKVGDVVSFRGEYEYNPKGGIIHWTHHDPQGQHDAGWIKHNGKTYD